MEEKITSILPIGCPHCSQTILVAMETGAPSLKAIVTVEDVTEAKNSLLSGVLKIASEIGEARTNEIKEWLAKEETIILPADVEKILNEIKNDSSQTNQNN